MKPSPVVEQVADWHAHLQIDRANSVVRNVALTGDRSKNGYRYTEEALKEAVSLYDQRPVFLDHASDKTRPQVRSTRDLVGSIVNPRFVSGRIQGDIRVLDTDSGRTFLALTESDAPGVGMSHVVLAERAKPDGAVAKIHDVVSVDAVVFPATTTTFRESQETSGQSEAEAGSVSQQDPADTALATDEQAASQPAAALILAADEFRQPDADITPETIEQQLQELLLERDELLTRLHDERQSRSAEQEEQSVSQLISNSGLPDYAVTETFRRLLAEADETLRQELIQERLHLIHRSRNRPPVSRERNASAETRLSDAVFVATLKGDCPVNSS